MEKGKGGEKERKTRLGMQRIKETEVAKKGGGNEVAKKKGG